MNREISTTCDSVESRLSQVWHCESGKMKNVLINRTLCSMVVWRRCSGSCAGQTRDRGRLEFCCRPPRLYGTAWLAHRPCRRTLGCLQDCSRHTGSAYSGTQLPTSNKTAAHELLVLQIKRKAQTPGSECVTHILSAPVCSTHFRAALQHFSIAALHS